MRTLFIAISGIISHLGWWGSLIAALVNFIWLLVKDVNLFPWWWLGVSFPVAIIAGILAFILIFTRK